jgi:hypothetical protein
MSNQYGPRITTSGLVFNMDFGNTKCYPGTGNNCYDLSANTLTGELGVANLFKPTYNTIVNNSYFVFNGSNTFIRIPNSTALDTNSVSVEVWIKTDNTNQNGFWFEKGTVNTQYSLFQNANNSIYWRHRLSSGGLSDLVTNAPITAGMNSADWFHVVGTYTSGTRRLFVNGVIKNSDTLTGNLSVNSGGMSIGAYGGYNGSRSYYYDGNLAVVRVYNRSLESYEVVNNFNANRKRFGV